jgi:regulatory protein
MPTITRLEQQQHDTERVNVYLDDEFAFGINIMDAVSLRKGQVLSEAEIAELRHKDAIVKAADHIANLLSYRPQSTQEVRQKLSKKGSYEEVVIEAAIERMTRMAYLDDRSFARFWIESRSRSKPLGKQALRYELRQKGIADALVQELLEELVDEGDAAYQAAEARVRRMRGSTQREFKQKLGAFLQRRGFRYDAVNQALTQLIEELNESEPDFFTSAED